MEETWKEIPNCNGKYLISTNGRVKTLSKYSNIGQYSIMKPRIRNEYLCVGLFIDGKQRNFRINRLVAMTFIPNPLNKPHVNHINGNKLDNRLDNLEWCTREENMQHAFANGLISKEGNARSINAMRKANIKPIYMIKNNKIINEFGSVDEASEYLGINKNLIYRVLCGYRKSTHKLTFKYKEKGI